MLAFLVGAAWAQVPEEIITETGSPEDELFLDGVVEQNLLYETRVLPYGTIREADVPYQRKLWRVIDIRQKFNLPFAYPAEPFITIILDGVSSGELVAFNLDDFKVQMTKDEIESKLLSRDTVPFLDPETYETTVKVVTNELNPEDVKKYRVKEIWYFEEEESRLRNRVLGIAPIIATYDEAGNFKYEGPMFWIYFPQAREYLAKHRAFVEGNDASPVTWESMFTMRKFHSYIFKSTNVMDNRIQDYPALQDDPIGQLYESDRVKSELFNWEQDLWSY